MKDLFALVTFFGIVGCVSAPSYQEALASIVADCDAARFSSVYERPHDGMSPFVVDFVVEAKEAQPYADCIFSAAKAEKLDEPTIIAGSPHTQSLLKPTPVGETS